LRFFEDVAACVSLRSLLDQRPEVALAQGVKRLRALGVAAQVAVDGRA
jgi:hypothetical protein